MSNVTKATISIMAVTMISKFLGFGRELVLGAYYGTSVYSDVYITASNIPVVLFSIIAMALSTTFIPLYYENYNEGGQIKANRFTNNIFNIVFIIGIIISIVVFVFAEIVVKMFAIGFEGEILKEAVKFTRIIMFGGVFIGLTEIMKSFLNIKEEFVIPGLIGLPYNIIIIISIILSVYIDIIILPIGTLLAIASQFLFQLPYARRKEYRYKCILDYKDKYIKKIMWLVAPVIIGVAVNQVNTMIDRTLASTLVEGSISALNYANRLNQFVMGMFIVSIGTVIYPILSKLSTDNNKVKFIDSLSKSINAVIILVIPISIGAIVLSRPIVKLLFERGAFDARATSMTSIALIFYSIGMIGFGLRDILGKVFYSLQDTKTPMVNGIITMVMNIILNFIFIKFMAHAGLALATSLSAIICIMLLFSSLEKKIGYYGQDKIRKTTIKVIISSVIMGIVTYIANNLMTSILGSGFIYDAIGLTVSIALGLIVYSILISLMKVEEVRIITEMILKKIKNK